MIDYCLKKIRNFRRSESCFNSTTKESTKVYKVCFCQIDSRIITICKNTESTKLLFLICIRNKKTNFKIFNNH